MLEKFASFINNQLIKSYQVSSFTGKIKHGILSILRALLIKMGDPACRMEIRGKTMYIPLSHPLAFNVTMNPHYDGTIERLSEFIRTGEGRLVYVDVGANIGDTILFCDPQKDDLILGIDADDLYLDFFKRNTGHYPNVKLIKAICSSSNGKIVGSTIRAEGTAKVVRNDEKKEYTRTLDSIIKEHHEYTSLNFLKVDTDGYDFEVLKGAKETVAVNKPAVLFECEVSDNERYTEEFLSTIQFFKECGYKSALLYDNLGYLFSVISLDVISSFKYPLFYQMSRDYYYYDILMMQEQQLREFLKLEISFFIKQMDKVTLRRAAGKALEL